MLFSKRPPWKFHFRICSSNISSGFPSMKYFIILYHCFKLSILTQKNVSLLKISIISLRYGLISSGSTWWILSTVEAKNSVINSFITWSSFGSLAFFMSVYRIWMMVLKIICIDLLIFSVSAPPTKEFKS